MASTFDGGGPVRDVLSGFLPDSVLNGRRPFVASLLIQEMPDDRVERLIGELDALSRHLLRDSGRQLSNGLGAGELPAYVTPGSSLQRRVQHAGLFAQRVLVPEPRMPMWGASFIATTSFLNRPDTPRRSTAEAPPQATTGPHRSSDAFLEELLDEIEADIERETAEVLPHVRRSLRPTAEQLLQYWWTISDAVGEGWVNIVDHGPFNSDNIRGLCYHAEFRSEVEAALSRNIDGPAAADDFPTGWAGWLNATERSWQALFAATNFANILGREHIVTFPGDGLTRDLIALACRYFTTIPIGGAFIGIPEPEPRHRIVGHGMVERGAWFDEVMLGLGPALDLIDMQTVSELRRSGTAAALQRFIAEDLGHVAFAVDRGYPVEEALAEAKNRLGVIAAAADERVNATSSAITRSRLKNAGIWGGNGLILGVLGGGILATAASGGILLPTVVLAGVGFALGALGGAASPSDTPVAGPEPVIFDLMSQLNRRR